MLSLPASTLPAEVGYQTHHGFKLVEAAECLDALGDLERELQIIDREHQPGQPLAPAALVAPGAMGPPCNVPRVAAQFLPDRVLVVSRKDPDGLLDVHKHALG